MNSTGDGGQRTQCGPDNPPRLPNEGESVADYRKSLGWDVALPANVQSGADVLAAPVADDDREGEDPVVEARSGALEKHPQFTYALADYQAWFASLPESERGRPGQRNWRARCVAKACELLFAKTGRATGSAVLKIIGFGSSTDVSTDVREWLDNVAPRRLEWLQVSPLLQSPAVQESVQSALKLITASAQREAKLLAEADLAAERAQLEKLKQQAHDEVAAALATRDKALQAASDFERERDDHAAARRRAEEQCHQMHLKLDETVAKLNASEERVASLERLASQERLKANTEIETLRVDRDRYSEQVARLEEDRRTLRLDVDEARRLAREQREDLNRRGTEVQQLLAQIGELTQQLAHQVSIAAAADQRTSDLTAEIRSRQLTEAALQDNLARALSELASERGLREARLQRVAAIQQEARRHPSIAELLQSPDAVLAVDGDTLPRMEIQLAGTAITPRFDSLSQLEAFCRQHRSEPTSTESST